jgi:hypothetical protein
MLYGASKVSINHFARVYNTVERGKGWIWNIKEKIN